MLSVKLLRGALMLSSMGIGSLKAAKAFRFRFWVQERVGNLESFVNNWGTQTKKGESNPQGGDTNLACDNRTGEGEGEREGAVCMTPWGRLRGT